MGSSRRPKSVSRGAEEAAEDYPSYCARPQCRAEIRRTSEPGRPNRYCSPTCRQLAYAEQRRAETKVRHMQALVRQAEIDLAAYTADETDQLSGHDTDRDLATAIGAAGAALKYLPSNDVPGLSELRELHDAVVAHMEATGSANVA